MSGAGGLPDRRTTLEFVIRLFNSEATETEFRELFPGFSAEGEPCHCAHPSGDGGEHETGFEALHCRVFAVLFKLGWGEPISLTVEPSRTVTLRVDPTTGSVATTEGHTAGADFFAHVVVPLLLSGPFPFRMCAVCCGLFLPPEHDLEQQHCELACLLKARATFTAGRDPVKDGLRASCTRAVWMAMERRAATVRKPSDGQPLPSAEA